MYLRLAAEIHRATRRQGHPVRRTSDCLIASVCIRERRPLRHADVDVDRLAACSELQVVVAAGQAVPSLPIGRRRSRTIASVGHCWAARWAWPSSSDGTSATTGDG